MERPGSRGGISLGSTGIGKAPTGSLLQPPERPGTGNRGPSGVPGTAAGRPPGTAMRGPGGVGGPPSSAYKRMGTAQGRPGTGQQAAAPNGPRTGTTVHVENRPITNHGVSGMKFAAPAGGGRKVLDKNFFMNELRQKRMEIANVTQSMQAELEALEKRQAQFAQMETHASKLMKEVKLQQEALADYNMVLDKVGSQTPTYTIQAQNAALRERNDAARKRVDEVLTERLQIEEKCRRAEAKINEIQSSMDARLAGMAPSQRQQYGDLVAEQAALAQESKRFEEAIDDLDKQLNIQEGELARNPLKQRSLALQDQIRQLTEKKYELQQEEERGKQSPEEQREQLMAKIKRDNSEVEQMTGQVKELQEQIKRMEARISAMSGNSPAVNAAEEATKREKFEELVAKERDLTNFMDSFPSRRADKLAELRSKQDAIVALLEKINKLQSIAGAALPSTKQFRQMQDELEYKKMQLENTQMTQERLKEELNMRRTELDKIDTLEDKIKSELEQLAEKSDQLHKNIESYANVADMKQRAEEARVRLEELKAALARRKDVLRQTVAEKALKNTAKKAQLQENTLQIAIDKMEHKLITLHTGTYQMSDFVRTKESETNYKVLAHSVTQLADEVNGLVKQLVE
ncbi:intraflagellar transport protein IFT-71/74 [Haematococcus lacustris]